MEEGEQSLCKKLRAPLAANGVAQRYLFKGEQKAATGFYLYGVCGDFLKMSFVQLLAKVGFAKSGNPFLMGLPFIVTFPGKVGFVPKSSWEFPEELPSGALEGRTVGES